MATTLYSDLKVYDEQFQGAFIETVMQNVDAFNAASFGALVLNDRPLRGHYEKEAFWDERVSAGSALARRDTTSTSTVTAVKLTQGEFVGVKLNRRVGPIETTLDAFRKAIDGGMSPDEASRRFSRVIGVQIAKAMPQEMLNRALAALEAKLDSVSALEHDATDGTLASTDLASGLKKFGDAADEIIAFVMHSGPYWDLVGNQITNAIYRANGVRIMDGVPATLGRPVIVTDSTSLVESDGVSSGVDAYSTLGLTRMAAELVFSEPPVAALEGPQTGKQNLVWTWQSEYAYNLKLRGCTWDTSNGGENPTDASVATATNWDTEVADNKLLPGVIIKSR